MWTNILFLKKLIHNHRKHKSTLFYTTILLGTYFYVIGISFDKTHFICIWVNLSRFKMIITSANLQASIPPRQNLDLLRFIKTRQMSRSIELTSFQIIASNVFVLKGYLFMGLYNPYWTRKT